MPFAPSSPVPPVCPEDLTQLELSSGNLRCPKCGREFVGIDGVYDLLPLSALSDASSEGVQVNRYRENFSQRPDRPWLQPLRRAAMNLSNGFLYRWGARQVKEFAQDRCLTILDAACGDGMFRYYLSPRHAYVGVDFSARVVARALRYHQASFFRADLNRLPFPSQSFDAVVSLQSLSHLEHPEKALAEMKRLLKPEGRLFLTVPNNLSYKYRVQGVSQIHVQHFNDQIVRDLVTRDFDLQSFETRGFWIPAPIIPIHIGLKASPKYGIAFALIATPKK